MRSPSSNAARKSANSGATKLNPIASAIGSLARPQKNKTRTTPTIAARSACRPSTGRAGFERDPADHAAPATNVATTLRHNSVL
jgi:hypothetical protein